MWTLLLWGVFALVVISVTNWLSSNRAALNDLSNRVGRIEQQAAAGHAAGDRSGPQEPQSSEEATDASAERIDALRRKVGALEEDIERDSARAFAESEEIAERFDALKEQVDALDPPQFADALGIAVHPLVSRLDALEHQIERVLTWTDSEFRRCLHDVAPWPLEAVYSFALNLQPHFWEGTLKLTTDEIATSRQHGGPLPVHVVIERWRSHRHILLYGDKNSSCPTRVLLLKEAFGGFGTVVLWQMEFGPSIDFRRVELYLEGDALVFGAVGGPFGHGIRHGGDTPLVGPSAAGTFISLPLSGHKELQQFLSDDSDEPENQHEANYRHRDDATGLSWSLHVKDLRGLHEFEIAEQYSKQ